ncbi:uncharacterized protein LOC120431843 isoform X1 [Culex pipiens pallens]|uniref:uncharacterized protein LOC120431843 isoform X1 n=1 Tax=Culex pipiens pallens TaxID=42434 RepID=UPI0019542868|nr:uncharacterized protein LOC120431843 isoform X1 [Culex pipiens pallens]
MPDIVFSIDFPSIRRHDFRRRKQFDSSLQLVLFGLDCNRIELVIVDVGLRKDFDRLIGKLCFFSVGKFRPEWASGQIIASYVPDIQNSVFVAVEEEDETHVSGGPGLRGGRRDRKEPSLWRIWFIPKEEEDETPSVKSSTQGNQKCSNLILLTNQRLCVVPRSLLNGSCNDRKNICSGSA